MKHLRLIVSGIVQGVGFRPFIYNLAVKYNLKGEVLNSTRGVTIDLEGNEEKIIEFIKDMKANHPPLAEIQDITEEEKPLQGYTQFSIMKSESDKDKQTLVSPDVAICDACLAELRDPSDRRYHYPFINCTNCGPRFTIIKDVPYDRPNTTMKYFEMCPDCLEEYKNPDNRRFHAQPNACEECGPEVTLNDRYGNRISTDDAIRKTAELLKEGKIVAIKGLGGYHFACDAKNDVAVKTLRERKYREDKPFAIMIEDIEEVKRFCHVSDKESELLTSNKRPILLLRKRKGSYNLADQVAPENDFLGVMKPYTPLHYILFEYYDGPLVMTSANVSDEPIAYKEEDALERLRSIADYFLMHNREIQHRCDDTVTRVFRGQEYVIRRARGYTPAPISTGLPLKQILACGGEQKNTFCLTKGSKAFISHHIGDLENIETLKSFSEGIELYKKLFEIKPEIIAYDLHPEYLSTKYALEKGNIKKIGIQHHHAHIVSCMVENNLFDNVIGVAFDGTGYGTDGHIWGGEFLISGLNDFERAAHLKYIPLPGGTKAIKEPWRVAASYLLDSYNLSEIEQFDLAMVSEVTPYKLAFLEDMISKNINSPLTSSMGRLFDAVAALLGIRSYVNYEGQGAIELEQKAWLSDKKEILSAYPFELKYSEVALEIEYRPLIKDILKDVLDRNPVERIAYKFHYTIAQMIVEVCQNIREKVKINDVCLSGGVFQNVLLLGMTIDLLKDKGFKPYIHNRVPTNDGGISLGQAVIANERS